MRHRRFSLRFVFLVVTAVAVILACVTHQRRIAAQLRSCDPHVQIYYRYQYNNFDDVDRYSFNSKATLDPTGRFVGPDVASTIVEVQSMRAEDPGKVMALASRLKHLRALSIQDTPLTDGELGPVVRLPHLRGLYLRGTAITDRSIATLSRLKTLRVLNIENTSVSDSAVAKLLLALPNVRVHSGPTSKGYF